MVQTLRKVTRRLSEITGYDIHKTAFNKYYSTSNYMPSYSKVTPDCDKLYGAVHNSDHFGFVSKFRMVLPSGSIIESQYCSYQSKDQNHEEAIVKTLGMLIKMYENPELGLKLDDDSRFCSNVK